MNSVALVDCNSFFCSCERVFQPRLARRPLVVLSSNDGCIVSRTDEAKALGLKMGEPYFKIKDFCQKNNVAVHSSNFALYGDMSRRVMRTLASFTPDMEIYSVDEAFLSMAGVPSEKLTDFGSSIRDTVFQHTGIPVSVGIAPNKVLAKVANDFAKKHKEKTKGIVSTFDYENIDDLLKQINVEDIWGIGRKSAAKLYSVGITTAQEFKYANEKMIQKLLSITGRNILEELRGEDRISLELGETHRKQIMSTRSFGRAVFAKEELQESLANHVSSAAERLRSQECVAGALMVFIQTNRFKNIPQYYNSSTLTLLSGTAVTNKLIKHAMSCLDKIFKEGYEYKRSGVILMDLQRKDRVQMDLFETYDNPREEALMQALDQVNEQQGKGTLKFAACGIDQQWKMLSQMRSRAYSTRWSDLLRVE